MGLLAGSFPALCAVFTTMCVVHVLHSSPSEAFESWERPLGWNPLYGPRFVVFWGGPAGYKDPPLGTCTYDHYATTPLRTEPPLAPFEDFYIAKAYEDAPHVVLSPKESPELATLTRLPFYEVRAADRYIKLQGANLPFSQVRNVPILLTAFKAIAVVLCVDFLQRLKDSSSSDGTAAKRLEAEAALLYVVVLAVYEAISKGQEAQSEERDKALYASLARAFKAMCSQDNWDSNQFAYWLDAANTKTEDGDPYYVPEMETLLFHSAVGAIGYLDPAADTSYSQLLYTSATFQDCNHFSSSQASASLYGRELLCEDSFFAATLGLQKVTERLVKMASERGKSLISMASKKLEAALANAAKAIKPESPFHSHAAEVLKAQIIHSTQL